MDSDLQQMEERLTKLCKWYADAVHRAEQDPDPDIRDIRIKSLSQLFESYKASMMRARPEFVQPTPPPPPLVRHSGGTRELVSKKRPLEHDGTTYQKRKKVGTCVSCNKSFTTNKGYEYHVKNRICLKKEIHRLMNVYRVRAFRFSEDGQRTAAADVYAKQLVEALLGIDKSITVDTLWPTFEQNLGYINEKASSCKYPFCFYRAEHDEAPPGITKAQASQMAACGLYKQVVDPGYSFSSDADSSASSTGDGDKMMTVREFVLEKRPAAKTSGLRGFAIHYHAKLPSDPAERSKLFTHVKKKGSRYKRSFLEQHWPAALGAITG